MNKARILPSVVGFASILMLGLFWTLMPILSPPQGIHPTDWTAADLILDRTKFSIINPKNISHQEDFNNVYNRWTISEIRARGLVVILPWALCLGAVIWKKQKQHG